MTTRSGPRGMLPPPDNILPSAKRTRIKNPEYWPRGLVDRESVASAGIFSKLTVPPSTGLLGVPGANGSTLRVAVAITWPDWFSITKVLRCRNQSISPWVIAMIGIVTVIAMRTQMTLAVGLSSRQVERAVVARGSLADWGTCQSGRASPQERQLPSSGNVAPHFEHNMTPSSAEMPTTRFSRGPRLMCPWSQTSGAVGCNL
jgi:hypothetical protein